jgi:hypothetical protein
LILLQGDHKHLMGISFRQGLHAQVAGLHSEKKQNKNKNEKKTFPIIPPQ